MTEDAGVPEGGAGASPLFIAEQAIGAYLKRYHRHRIDGCLEPPAEQVLFVANHGFGGLFDLNVAALLVTGRLLAPARPTTVLVHQVTWTFGLGRLVEPLGFRPASRAAAEEAFDAGHHVLVLPGGDLDAFKAHKDRNQIVFGGRSGFAKLAISHGVPVMPIVTAGAGNSLFVLSDGQGLAKRMNLDRLIRLKALPISLSLPWGLTAGVAGFGPYLPLPTTLRTRVLSPMHPLPAEKAEEFAGRVERAMQEALSELSGPAREG